MKAIHLFFGDVTFLAKPCLFKKNLKFRTSRCSSFAKEGLLKEEGFVGEEFQTTMASQPTPHKHTPARSRPHEGLNTWRIIPVSKRLIATDSKSPK